MIKKMLALLCVVLLLTAMLCSCGQSNSDKINDDTDSISSNINNDSDSTDASSTEPSDNVGNNESNSTEDKPFGTVGTGVAYIGSQEEIIYSSGANAVSYCGDNRMYGIKNMDGTYDSGAIYYDAEIISQQYFSVQTSTYENPNNFDSINSSGVVTASGKVLIPAEYALIKSINQRFYQVFTVTAITGDSSDYLLRLSSSMFALTAQDGDILYTGYWEVYDIQEGRLVPNVKDTSSQMVYLNGDVLTYKENGKEVSRNAAGQPLPKGCRLFADGSYCATQDLDSDNTVYDSSMNIRFHVKKGSLTPSRWENGYYIMHNYKDNVDYYAVADESGNVLLTYTDRKINSVWEGGLLRTSLGLSDLEGNLVSDIDFSMLYYYDGYWIAHEYLESGKKNLYMIDSDHNVTYVCQTDDSFSSMDFVITQKECDINRYYSVKQKKFVDGMVINNGVAEITNADGTKTLINTMTDELLLSGYNNYSVVLDGHKVCYIAARVYKESGTYIYDFFQVK